MVALSIPVQAKSLICGFGVNGGLESLSVCCNEYVKEENVSLTGFFIREVEFKGNDKTLSEVLPAAHECP